MVRGYVIYKIFYLLLKQGYKQDKSLQIIFFNILASTTILYRPVILLLNGRNS